MKGKKEAHVYLPEDVFDTLKILAELNHRSISGEIIKAVEQRIRLCKARGQDLNSTVDVSTETRPRR